MKRQIPSSIGILTIFLIGCYGGKQSDTSTGLEMNSDTIANNTINAKKIDQPLGYGNLIAFKQFSDSIIRIALNKKSLSYVLHADTFQGEKVNNVYSDYFDSESLKKVVKFKFSLPSPKSSYSFTLMHYEYASTKSAFTALDKVATVAYASESGLNKQPAYVFRIANYLYWLSTPHSLSGKTFKALKRNLSHQLEKHAIEDMESHVKFTRIYGFDQEGFKGKWKLKFISSIFQDDTVSRTSYENTIFEIQNDILKVDSLNIPIFLINKLELPDIRAFFQYRGYIYHDNLSLNEKLKKFRGSVIEYSISFGYAGSSFNKKHHQLLLSQSLLRSFIKISDTEFGFIKDDHYYELVKVNQR